jgi:hypothetical protein
MSYKLAMAGAVFAGAVIVGSSTASAITYYIGSSNVPPPVLPLVLDALTLKPAFTPGSITGTIATDNRLGPLLAADIVSWNMTVTVIDGTSTLVQTITPANSNFQFVDNDRAMPGYGFYATSATLFYDFSFGGDAYFQSLVFDQTNNVFRPIVGFSPTHSGYFGLIVDPSTGAPIAGGQTVVSGSVSDMPNPVPIAVSNLVPAPIAGVLASRA